MQAEFESKVIGICEQENKKRAEMFVTEYTNACLERVDRAYGELVDYLMFRYLYNHADVALPERIKVGALEIPDLSKRG